MTMSRETCDVVILGAGFAGSLLALMARRSGLDVVLLERGRHPRFAIGESSTPLANLKLESLAATYDLPWLKPLAKYGPWKRAYPQIPCGLKRGFSFFHHAPGSPFVPTEKHDNELLVAANPDAEHGDTHWYRADFDALINRHAIASGVCYIDHCCVSVIDHEGCWRIRGTCDDGPFEINASFAVDATGRESALARALGLRSSTHDVRTSSRALYGHFRHVAPWTEVLQELGDQRSDDPFSSDAAALHHVIDGGWMWVLRFDNGITSAGFSLDPNRHPIDGERSPEQEWTCLLAAYPSIQRQFADATVVQPIVRTDRMQRRITSAAGESWALLPHSACFLDPWLSPGIAHSLFGVERLGSILAQSWSSSDRPKRLAAYSLALSCEMEVIDQITAACFAQFDCFPLLVAITMLYFSAATFSEEQIRAGHNRVDDAFLLAHDARFASIVADLCKDSYKVDPANADGFMERVAASIEPYNVVGLCDPARCNMYPFAATASEQ